MKNFKAKKEEEVSFPKWPTARMTGKALKVKKMAGKAKKGKKSAKRY